MHRNFILSLICHFWAFFVDSFVAGYIVKVIEKKKENNISANKLDVTVANISKEKKKKSLFNCWRYCSHIRECASKVRHNLNKNYRVTGMVKPGSIICTLAISALEFVHTLMKYYVLLINGGT
jgi:hypothetical protein